MAEKSKIVHVNDLMREYKVDPEQTPAQRLAGFLDMAAKHLPLRWIDRRIAAKIAFALKNIPREDSEYVSKVSSVFSRTKEILIKDYNRHGTSDRVDGYRASTDENDKIVTSRRASRQRAIGAVKNLIRIDASIDVSKATGSAKKELTEARKADSLLSNWEKNVVPLLPEKTKEKE